MASLPEFPSVSQFRDAIRSVPDLAGANEPGFAATYDYSPLKNFLWNYGALAPVGAASAGLWYLKRREQAKARAAKAQHQAPQYNQPKTPLLKAAAPDLKQILENIRWHLPKVRVPDTIAGMALGGGAGALYDAIKGRDAAGNRRTGQRMLTGALAGAGVANLLGDRTRRYVSNTKLPAGYMKNPMASMAPSLKKIWNAAILDKQQFDPEEIAAANNLAWNKLGDPVSRTLPMRYEIVRRQFGLPVPNADNAWFKKTPEGYYSLNENSPDYQKRLKDVFGSFEHKGIKRAPFLYSGPDRFLHNPERALTAFNQFGDRQSRDYDFFGSHQLFGGMQVPFIKNPDKSVSGMALDRWDQTPNQQESQFIRDNWLKMLTNSKWRQGELNDNLSWYLRPGSSHTNGSAMGALAGRWSWDNILSDELPWVGQKFKIAPRTTAAPISEYASGTNAPNTFQFLKADNSPATPAMGFSEFDAWDKNK